MCHGHETTFFAGGDPLRSGTLTQQFLIRRIIIIIRMFHLLGMMETVLSARRTRNVLRPARLPISMKEVR